MSLAPTGDLCPIDYRTLLEGSQDMVWMVQVQGATHRFVYCTPSTASVLGYSGDEFLRMSNEDIFTPESLRAIAEDVRRLRGEGTTTVIVEAVRKDGRHIWLENKVRMLRKAHDGTLHVVIYGRDVTERKLLQDQLSQMAFLDGLTGIQNRRAFDMALEREWKRAARCGLPLSLALLDVDYFKRFNDTYGHLTGDDCLRAIAGAARICVRRPEDVVARFGGEELAVLLPGTSTGGAEHIAERICASVMDLQVPHVGNDGRGVVTMSGGVATAVASAGGTVQMPEGLLLAADEALYRAKHRGRSQVATAQLLRAPSEWAGGTLDTGR